VNEFSDFLIGFIDLNVPEGARVHVHASPPCQNMSSANPIRNEDVGMTLVNWSLQLMSLLELQLKDRQFTWSMEQVPNKKICQLIDEHGGVKVDMSKFGIPQIRRRVFLGTLNWENLDLSAWDAPQTLAVVMDTLGYAPPNGMTSVTSAKVRRDSNEMPMKHPDGKTVYNFRSLDCICSTITSSSPSFYDPIRPLS